MKKRRPYVARTYRRKKNKKKKKKKKKRVHYKIYNNK